MLILLLENTRAYTKVNVKSYQLLLFYSLILILFYFIVFVEGAVEDSYPEYISCIKNRTNVQPVCFAFNLVKNPNNEAGVHIKVNNWKYFLKLTLNMLLLT